MAASNLGGTTSSKIAKHTTAKTNPKTKAAATAPPLLYKPYPLTNEWGFQDATEASQPVSTGYDVTTPRLQGRRRTAALNQVNSILTSPIGGSNYQMSLFVIATQMNAQLAGSTAQGRLTRDFYPHNFVQGTITVTGVSLDQDDYGLLCEFVHAAQHNAIDSGYYGLTQLFVAGKTNPAPFGGALSRGIDGHRPTNHGNRQVSVAKSSSGSLNGSFWNQNIRGSHKPILAQGYVNSMPREHEQFEYAVEWELDFIVAVMIDGIYNDSLANAAQLQSMLQDSNDSLMTSVKADALPITAALKKQNKAALAYAAKNASTYYPPSQSTTTTGSSGSGSGGGTGAAPKGGVSVPGISSSDAESAITSAITQYNVPAGIFYGMFNNETSLGAGINTSSTGAIGPFQFEPSTASTYNYPLTNTPNLQQFQEQANAAAHFLSLLDAQTGSWADALAAYNAGPANLAAGEGYAQKAISWAQGQGLPVS